MTEVHQLLAQYAKTGSEAAFQEIVQRYVDLVYGTARRWVQGDIHAAQDITQRVFVDLAKMAGGLSRETLLGGWLHRHTCFLARRWIRTETRRKARERLAMEIQNMNSEDESFRALEPVLDDAINHLSANDRQAVVLRFFERQEFNALGRGLGISEEAARKRVVRALEKLRCLLAKRGVVLSGTALATALTTHVMEAAPLGLAAMVSAAAAATASAGGGTAPLLLYFIHMTKLKTGIAAALAVAVTAPWIVQQRQKQQFNDEVQTLRAQLADVGRLRDENERLSNLVAHASAPATDPQSAKQAQELVKLRGQVGALRKAVDEAAAAPKPSTSSVLSGLTQNPEMWKMLRDQQKLGLGAIYRAFGKQANVAPEKLEALNNLLADDVMENIHHITELLREGKGSDEMERVFAQQETDLHTKVKGLMGEDGLIQFKDFNRNLLSRLSADQFVATLGGDRSAREGLSQQLFEVFQDETQKAIGQAGLAADYQTVPTLNFRNFVSEEEAEKNLQLLDGIYEQAQTRFAAILKPEEVEKFGEFRKIAINNNRLALAMNRKMMAPPSK